MPRDHVTLQFSSSTAWQSTLIRKCCHGPFSHVDLVLPDGNLLGASDQGPDSPCIEGNRRGVAIRPADYQPFKIRVNAVFETDKTARIEELARGQLGKAFDDSALYQFFDDNPFDRDWRVDEHWFCIELHAWAFEQGGFWLPITQVPWTKSRVTPTDFLGWFMFDPRFVNRDEFFAETRRQVKLWK